MTARRGPRFFSPAVPMAIFIDKNKSQADVESLKWDGKKGKIGF